MSRPITRRRALALAASAGALSLYPFTHASAGPAIHTRKRNVIVLGMDGMDPQLLQRFMAEGVMPTFKRFLERGSYRNLRTTMPPQSPVAWSSFITGCEPGGHGIFDFVHRDPKDIAPYLSTSRAAQDGRSLSLGSWQIPLGGGEMQLMRKGPTLWDSLDTHGVPATVFQIPANFPVIPGATRAVSGMGTPDLLGGYGVCSYYSDEPMHHIGTDGAHLHRVKVIDHAVHATLRGPANYLRADGRESEIPFTIHRDPWESVLKIEIQEHVLVLRKGEWSDWLPIRFTMLPGISSIGGMVRFFVKQVHPQLKLYVSPINVDPFDPVFPIAGPDGYVQDLAASVGRFYTQGLPADTKALQNKILSDEEFFSQAKLVLEENMRVLHHELDRHREGLLFFYFSSTDQCAHMLLRAMDPTHPQYREDAPPEAKNAIRYLYTRMDEALRDTLAKAGTDSTVIVLSDHGFCSFTREVHLGTWLAQQGFLTLGTPAGTPGIAPYGSVEWSKTKAYALGINGVYLNLKDREPNGIVSREEAPALKAELRQRLEALVDPVQGRPVVYRVYDAQEFYQGPWVGTAPDLLIGYHPGYRSSDEAILGIFSSEVFTNRTSKWASDHCVDPSFVPGVLLTNQEVRSDAPAIWDLAPSILERLGLPTPAAMTGRSIF